MGGAGQRLHLSSGRSVVPNPLLPSRPYLRRDARTVLADRAVGGVHPRRSSARRRGACSARASARTIARSRRRAYDVGG